MIHASYLHTILTYNASTGDLSNKVDRRKGKAGAIHQARNSGGYIVIHLQGKLYRAQDVVWCMVTGSWPELTVDHENGIRDDNRWENLRLAERYQNRANSRVGKNNKLGVKGVSKAGNRYKAYIRVAGQLIHLGQYNTPEEASEAYQEAAKIAFGEFANAG